MEDRDELLIEKYLARELTEGELAAFDQRRREDPAFDQEVREFETAMLPLKLRQREMLRQRFARRDIELDHSKPPRPRERRRWFLWIGTLTILILLIALSWRLFQDKPEAPFPSEAGRGDSTQHYPQEITGDSVQAETPDQKPEDSHEKRQTDPAKAIKQPLKAEHGDLFAAYFEPYRHPMMDPTDRGETKTSALEKFRKAYWDGTYAEVPGLFESIDETAKQNDTYRFQLANALLYIGKTNEAISILENIIAHNRSPFASEAYFTLGMAYLRIGDKEKAKKQLLAHMNHPKARQKEKAQKVLNALGI